jgi:lipopolysaccharide export system protein LptA
VSRVARAIAAAVALLALPPQAARAQGIDLAKGGGVEITARDGIEWRQAEQVVVARGDARAVREGVTVNADRLIARYRPQGGEGTAAASATAAAGPGLEGAGGSSEIWRLEAEGRVRIATATDTARGDRAVYDIDQAVLVLSGRDLALETGQQVITARDSLEYWSQRRMAVARGGAVVVDRQDGRRITADTLVAYFLEDPAQAAAGGGGGAQSASAAPAAAAPRVRTPGGQEVPGAGRLDRVEAFGNVEIRTPLEVVRGDRGVYSAATGMARLLGDVRITRGDNQLNGREAIVNLATGVARLVAAPGGRVQGLVVPQQQQQQQQPSGGPGGGAVPQAGGGAEGRGGGR